MIDRIRIAALALCLIAGVDPGPGVGVRGVGVGGGGPRSAGTVAAPTPTFQVDYSNAGTDSGVGALSADVTIDSTTVSPTCRFKMGDCDATDCNSWGGSVTVEAGGSGGSFNQGSPLLGSNDDSFATGGTRWYEDGDNTTCGDFGTDDVLVEGIFTIGTTTNEAIAGKRNSASPNLGWLLYANNSSEIAFAFDWGASVSEVKTAAVPVDTWFHFVAVADRSGDMRAYLNGTQSGTDTNISAQSATSVSNADNFNIASQYGGSVIHQGQIAYLAFYKEPGWFTDEDIDTWVAQRFATLTGVVADIATASAYPTSMTRASTATVRNWTDSSTPSLFTVGAGWPIMESAKNEADTAFVGLRGLNANTQYSTNTGSFSSGWTLTNSTVSATTTATPIDGTAAAGFVLDEGTATGSHDFRQNLSTSVASEDITVSVYCKPYNRDWAAVQVFRSGVNNPFAYVNCSTCAIGTTGGTGFIDASARSYGDWCQVMMHGTVSSATNTLVLYAASGDGTASYTGSVGDAIAFFGPNVWDSNPGAVDRPYHPALTGSTTATTNQAIVYEGSDNIGGDASDTGTADCDILYGFGATGAAPTVVGAVAYLDDSGSTVNTEYLYLGTESGDGGALASTGEDDNVVQWAIADADDDLDDGASHEIRLTWTTNDINTYADGVADGTPDGGGTIPTSLDGLYIAQDRDGGNAIDGHVTQCTFYGSVMAP